MECVAQSFADQAKRLSMFTGVSQHDPDDKFFFVMGMTGCGKSTFISQCTGKSATISSGLHSCTDSIDVYDFMFNGRRIHLVDTPGFNNTSHSDIDILGILASWLGASYGNGVRIHGLIILHPISGNRVSGSSMRNIAMIKAVCGFESYANAVVVTTMWPAEPTDAETTTLEARETELLSDDKFFGFFIARNAHFLRHNEDGSSDITRVATSARRIVSYLVEQSEMHAPNVLQLQREIVDEGKTLDETAAGIAAAGELYKERKAHEQHLKKLRADMSQHLDESNVAYTAQLRELEADAEQKLKKADGNRHTLKQRMEDWHENELKALGGKIEEIDRLFCEDISVREEELREIEESLSEMRKDLARRSQKPREEHQKAVDNAREQIAQVRKARQNLNSQFEHILMSNATKNNIVNGSVNGLFAGVTSGIIAAVAAGLMCTVM
ncbi:hypothetical protein F4801DRAFT_538048 [Xylaria longipes]|nr:hypothetical protein F4801DRAFT_538048 [Xylaria longipes]RYC60017.1 hypothetical protein CHU98_g6191 [Xylaria longipes]